MITNLKSRFIVLILLLLFCVQSFHAISSKSATFDEVQYFGIGKYLIKNSKWDIMGAILHPPLAYYLNAIPMLFVEEDKKIWEYDVKNRDLTFLGSIDYYRGQEILSSNANAGDRLLIASRTMTLLLAILLGIYVYRFSAMYFGVCGGLISLFFFSFCPNMLAYSGISVPDMPLTVFTLITVYYLVRALTEDIQRYTIYAGIFLGLALLSKFSAMLLLPIELILTLITMYLMKRNLLPRLMLIFSVGAFILVAGYQFDITPMLQGYKYRLMQKGYGQGVFLLGEYSNQGWWYFYPLTVLLKTSLPVLVLFPTACIILAKKWRENVSKLVYLLIPIFAFMLFFSFSGYSVGLRYVLPIYPFIFVALGAITINLPKRKYLYSIAAGFYLISTMYVAPNYLAYFNEAIKGAGNGYKYLVDSNLDWGQDLKGLKKYMDVNGIHKISLSYFGADTPARYGINYDWLPSHYLYNPEPEKPYEIKPDQLVAVSVTNLQGVYLDNINQYKWLLQYEPVAKIGYSIYVYDLSGLQR
jgi:4-amino-4-deoxy-L-arabinose transferase-like glycosyltransferase